MIEEAWERGAGEWAENGLSYCSSGSCRTQGKLCYLLARIALLNGDTDGAMSWAAKALRANRTQKNLRETANSLRRSADAKVRKHADGEAHKDYAEALVLDKKLGLSRKIVMDLIGIGETLSEQGRSEEALGYYRRALSVSESAGDKEGVARSIERIKREMAAGGTP